MSYQTILYEQQDAVALITLNRPDKLNAWTYEMRDELLDAVARSNDNPDIGAMVVTGAGRAFCAGADIENLFKKQIDDEGEKAGGSSANWVTTVRDAKPMIAAVNGHSVGVGLTMILPFDYIIASEEAKFCCAFVKMGVVTELASSYFLVQRMGFGPASEAALSGRVIKGEEAALLGLADRLTVPDRLLDTAMEVAGAIAQNPSRQLRMVKQLLTRNGADPDVEAVMAREFKLLDECYKSAEHKEAVDAFLEKRKPDFRKAAAAD